MTVIFSFSEKKILSDNIKIYQEDNLLCNYKMMVKLIFLGLGMSSVSNPLSRTRTETHRRTHRGLCTHVSTPSVHWDQQLVGGRKAQHKPDLLDSATGHAIHCIYCICATNLPETCSCIHTHMHGHPPLAIRIIIWTLIVLRADPQD